MYGELKKGKYVTYGCGHRRIDDIKCTAKPRYVSERILLEETDKQLQKISVDSEGIKILKKTAKEIFDNIDEESSLEMSRVNSSILKNKKKLSKLFDYLDDDLITKEEYLTRKGELQKQLAKDQAKYEALTNTTSASRTSLYELLDSCVDLHKIMPKIKDVSHFRTIFETVFSNLVFNRGKLKFELTDLGKLLSEVRNFRCGGAHCISLRSLKEKFKKFYFEWAQSNAA